MRRKEYGVTNLEGEYSEVTIEDCVECEIHCFEGHFYFRDTEQLDSQRGYKVSKQEGQGTSKYSTLF